LNLQSSDYKAGVLTSRPPSLDEHTGEEYEYRYKLEQLALVATFWGGGSVGRLNKYLSSRTHKFVVFQIR